MVVRTGVVAMGGADEGQVLDPRHVGGSGAVQIASGEAGLIERQEILGRDQFALESSALRLAPVAPVHAIGLSQPGDFLDPGGYVVTQGS